MTRLQRLKPVRRLLWAVVLLWIAWAPAAQAKFYRYVDEEGRMHFVDDLSKVPAHRLENLEAYSERYDHLTPTERGERIRQDREAAMAVEEQRRREEAEAEERRRAQQSDDARRESAKALAAQQETKVVVLGNQILVPVTLGHGDRQIEARMLLDTGAASVVLHREVAERLNLQSRQRALARVVGGRSVTAGLAELDQLAVGPFQARGITVLIIAQDGPSLPFDGLLGMNFLRNVKYSVDYGSQVIRWQP